MKRTLPTLIELTLKCLVRNFAILGIFCLFAGASQAEPISNSAPLDRPSFSCASPHAVEAVICADSALAARDRTMAALYAAAQMGALGPGSSQEQERQRQWLKYRDKHCGKGQIQQCLANEYDDRLKELAVAALFQVPETALAEIMRQHPKAAPLYEAIYRYATIDSEAERIHTVAPLIIPAFEAVRVHPAVDSEGIHAPAEAERLFVDIPSAQAAASSDKNFSTFIDVVSVSSYLDDGYELTMPCVALVRKPGLIDALGARFGGAIDGQIISSDCKVMMPATPNLDYLTKAVEKEQQPCQGTIGISLYRDYLMTLDAVRLHNTDIWKKNSKPSNGNAKENDDDASDKNHSIDESHFRRFHQAWIDSALKELTAYYVLWFKVPPQIAKIDASGAVNAIVADAYNLCE